MSTTAKEPRVGAGRRLRLSHLLRPYRPAIVLALIAVLGETSADLMEPWPLKIVLDYVLQSKHMPDWLALLVHRVAGTSQLAILNVAVFAVAIIALLGAVSAYSEKYLTTSVGQWVTHDLRRTLYHHIHRLSLSQYDEARTGDLISRVTSDIEAIQDFVTSAMLGIVVDVVTIAGMITVMFIINWQFTLIALSIVPPLFVVVYVYTRRIKKASREVRKKESELVSIVQEVFSSIRVVQAFAREDYEEKRFEGTSLESVEMALHARAIKARLSPIVDVIVAVGTCLVLWYGARIVLEGRMTAGSLVVFVLYLSNMYKPMRDLSKMTDTVSKASVGYERIKEVVETESRVRDLPRARRAPHFRGDIKFEDVSFSYQPDTPVLKNVSLEIKPAQTAAFVGPTGAGKSTIISLIARFYDPTSGVIKIDGQDIRSYTLRSLRQQMSFVLQDTLLFRAPLWKNIAYGKPEARRSEIVRAAELANAHEFIEKLPEGYDTVAAEKGVSLSGGQRQRIAIARAILRGSPILILDEPTSSLDASSEQLVVEALERLMEGKTSIIIAHHLATIRKAGVIFVVKDGSVVEQGTHDQLIAADGVYAELFSASEASPVAKPAD
jgi:ATP-binding cassette subfamily B protein